MVDEKCDYCKLIDEKSICIAESKTRLFDEFAWAEDYSKCDSASYRECVCYLYEIQHPQIKIEQTNFKNKSISSNLEDDFA